MVRDKTAQFNEKTQQNPQTLRQSIPPLGIFIENGVFGGSNSRSAVNGDKKSRGGPGHAASTSQNLRQTIPGKVHQFETGGQNELIHSLTPKQRPIFLCRRRTSGDPQ